MSDVSQRLEDHIQEHKDDHLRVLGIIENLRDNHLYHAILDIKGLKTENKWIFAFLMTILAGIAGIYIRK
jgi:hypothetical protein